MSTTLKWFLFLFFLLGLLYLTGCGPQFHLSAKSQLESSLTSNWEEVDPPPGTNLRCWKYTGTTISSTNDYVHEGVTCVRRCTSR